MLPSSSWAKKASSVSESWPALMSRSHRTTVRTPSITLVRSVTVNTTRCSRRPFPRFARPSKVNCIPGVSGDHRLSMVVDLENLLRSKSVSTTCFTAALLALIVVSEATSMPLPLGLSPPHAASGSTTASTAATSAKSMRRRRILSPLPPA